MKPKTTYSTFAVLTLVLLRVGIGWHFYSEGAKKLQDPEFSSAGFLRQAKGPWAEFFHSKVPVLHDWKASAEAARVPEEGWQADLDAWLTRYNNWRKSVERGQPKELKYSDATAFGPWARQIVSDWRSSAEQVKQLPGFADQAAAVDSEVLQAELALADFFAASGEEFQAYASDRVRLGRWQQAPTTGELPFHDERIVQKRAELNATARSWARTVRDIEQDLVNTLTELLPAAERSTRRLEVQGTYESPAQRELRQVDTIVTWWVLGSGALLVIGLFTPLAALAAVAFLLSVMATQPPWVPEANTDYFYYQMVEVLALLVLAFTAAGRWLGLDVFLAKMFAREGIA